MSPLLPTLFDEASERLPLFDDLPDGAVERLAAGELGRGLLTASLRARLRRAGLVDMGMLALATPIDLMAVRKIGPVRVGTIRAHVLDELARLYLGARAIHNEDATTRRRMDRLHATPAERLPRDAAALARLLAPDKPCAQLRPATGEGDAAHEAKAKRERAEALRKRDREWDEAAPTGEVRTR